MPEDNELKICTYCKCPILDDENYIKIGQQYFHYDKENRLNNCYFPEDEEE